jgi:xanthine/CO dehydrogenase XdhC/CoxF family maturation factor
MQGIDRDVLGTAARWLGEGHDAWRYTVVRTWGSSPRLQRFTSIHDQGQRGHAENQISDETSALARANKTQVQ